MAAVEATLVSRTHARLRRLDARALVAVLVMGLAFLIAQSTIQAADKRVPVLVLVRPVQAGAAIIDEDIGVVDAAIPPSVPYLPASARAEAVGAVAATALPEGTLLAPGAITQRPPLPPGSVSMSVAVAPEHANAGALSPGARVGVIAAPRSGEDQADATVLFSGVPVLGVRTGESEEGGGLLVTLQLSLAQARALAGAVAAGQIDLVLEPPRGGRR